MIQNIELMAPEIAFKSLPDQQTVVVTDHNVAGYWKGLFVGRSSFSVAPGEESKTWEQTGDLVESLVEAGVSRSSTIAAVGGGVVGDLAGFAASVLLRGIDLVQIPTTLLAMVDSSIGGKVGVDLKSGKNLAGAFWPAKRIIICPAFLSTLPIKEWQCGSAEVWKYGAILDASLWEQLLANPVKPGRPKLDELITACAEHKLRVVKEDPYETSGLRAILNFGHTVGHAIEWALGYGSMTHGEAISIGMVLEARLGERLGLTEKGTEGLVKQGLGLQGLPLKLPSGLLAEDLMKAMARDKKAGADGLAFSLLTKLGECKLVKGVPPSEVLGILRNS